MAGGPTISQQKILAAAGGNADLLEVLHQVAQIGIQQQDVTSTRAAAGTSSSLDVNPAAKVPAQATGSVSILGGAYVVQIVNPGGTNPISQVQARQQAGNASSLTSLQPVTPIRHQIRASTSPAFNVNSNTQTFGGTQGSTQTYWTLTGLGSGTWYIQFRSSYDGINFNTWKNANGGTALGGLINQVTTENAGNSEWAVFTLPGKLIAGIGVGEVSDQEIFGLASQVYSSGMFAIAGPNGFPAQGNGVSGWTLCDVDVQVPSTGTAGITGIPDFPVEIRCQMAQASSANVLPSNASVFAIAFDPSNENVSLYQEPGGGLGAVWAVVKLPGGARVAFGQGKNLDGTNIYVPPSLTFVSPSRMMSICSLTDAPASSRPPMTGVGINQISGLTVEGAYLRDNGALDNRGLQNVNWLVIAWEPGTDVQMVGGFPFLTIQLQGGHAIILGAGQVASGTPVVLPAGFSSDQMLSLCTPAGSANTGDHMRGVQQCSFVGLTPYLTYTDNSSIWDGPVNFLLTAWK